MRRQQRSMRRKRMRRSMRRKRKTSRRSFAIWVFVAATRKD